MKSIGLMTLHLLAAILSGSLHAEEPVPLVPAPAPIRPVETILVDAEATGYGTFQSHNQKVLRNGRGIFMTHIRSRNDDYTAQQWRLSQSTDGGATFATIYEATDATNPPVIESDSHDRIYLVRPDFKDGKSYLYRFDPATDYLQPTITEIPASSHGKVALELDEARGHLYYFSANASFTVLDLDGRVLSSVQLVKPGEHAGQQYPLLFLETLDTGAGTLHAGWTTQKHDIYLYWDIHHMASGDAGGSWHNVGKTDSLPLPVIADETGPADRITLDDEFDCHTWLSNMIVHRGKIHFAYLAQSNPPRQHYVRVDASTGAREIDLQPDFKGATISLMSLDGFFSAESEAQGGRLYYTSSSGGRIGTLISEDNGNSWRDFAVSEGAFSAYAIGGCPTVTPEGWIMGSFTDQAGATPADTDKHAKVFFIRVRAACAAAKE